MNIVTLINKGDANSSQTWKEALENIVKAIILVVNPLGSDSLTLRCISRDKKSRNGVNELKRRFSKHLLSQSSNWCAECKLLSNEIYPHFKVGKSDFVYKKNEDVVIVEWETGNISSSHRSLNKMVLALKYKLASHAVLILPSRLLYKHLTDRVGNVDELRPYFELWESCTCFIERGLLVIYVVEYDKLSEDERFPYLVTGKDGNAKRRY